jgi:GNAT superfamily N-acetyltransferase
MNIKIEKLQGKSDTKKFIKCQRQFYVNEPNFVTPLMLDQMDALDIEKNPFYKHSKIQLFIAKNDNKIVGRIAAIVNDRHNELHNDEVGFFGFFECIDNVDVAKALFDSAGEWLKANGKTQMRGPANPSLNDTCGVLVEGFDSPPVVLMPYNPKYYDKLIKDAGLPKVMDLFAYDLWVENYLTEKMERMQGLLRERYQITTRDVNFKDKEQFRKDVDTLKMLYNAAWEPNWGFVKMTDEEFEHLAKGLKMIAEPTLTFMVESKGKTVGFALGLLDINQVLKNNPSGATIPGVWQLLTKRKKIDSFRIIVLGVLPEYQKTGIDAIMYYEFGIRCRNLGMKHAEASWILENNVMMNRALTQTLNGIQYKTYRMYERNL